MVDAKRALRKSARIDRDRFVAEYPSAAEDVAAFADVLMAKADGISEPVVSAYLAIGNELDPAALVAALRSAGATIALPVMVGKDKPLEFRAWNGEAELVEVQWGIREPGPACPVVEPDVALVPLLAADRAGNRLGYGGGFYDRSLNQLRARKKISTIGLGYPGQMVDSVPHEDYDERLDYFLSPSGLHTF